MRRTNRLELLPLALLLFCFGSSTVAQKSTEAEARMQPSVGMVTRSHTDEKRKNWQRTGPRPLRTAVWYPPEAGTGESETIFGGPSEKQLFAPVTVPL